jgi:exodeoxyribonuclease III
MHVVSLNVNGIRAAVRRGLLGWIAERRPDLICLQEIRATNSQLPLPELEQLGYESVWNLGSRPGYAGVGILGRVRLEPVADPLDDPNTEHEGRFLAARAGETVVTSSYVPNGNSGPERLAVKLTHLSALRELGCTSARGRRQAVTRGRLQRRSRTNRRRPADAPDGVPAERTGKVRGAA